MAPAKTENQPKKRADQTQKQSGKATVAREEIIIVVARNDFRFRYTPLSVS
jgi:hypothetical protein